MRFTAPSLCLSIPQRAERDFVPDASLGHRPLPHTSLPVRSGIGARVEPVIGCRVAVAVVRPVLVPGFNRSKQMTTRSYAEIQLPEVVLNPRLISSRETTISTFQRTLVGTLKCISKSYESEVDNGRFRADHGTHEQTFVARPSWLGVDIRDRRRPAHHNGPSRSDAIPGHGSQVRQMRS